MLAEIEQNGINVYTLPDCDEDEDDDYKEQCTQLKVGVCSRPSYYEAAN